MERTLVIIKPCGIRRGLIGEVIQRFERRGLQLSAMKMVQLTEDILDEHYAHLVKYDFFQRIKETRLGLGDGIVLKGIYKSNGRQVAILVFTAKQHG